jgi:hypothetical protein
MVDSVAMGNTSGPLETVSVDKYGALALQSAESNTELRKKFQECISMYVCQATKSGK